MSTPKTVALTLGERMAALKVFDGFKGSITTLSTLLDDVKNFVISPEEWTAANLVKTPNADGTEQWKWDDTGTKDVEMQEGSADYLLEEIKKKSDANEVTLADAALLSLNKKLK